MDNQIHDVYIPESKLPRIVVVGCGFAGFSFIKAMKGKPFQIVLLDQNNFHQFQPLLYQVATSGIEPDSIVFPARKMFENYPNFHFRMTKVFSVNFSEKTLDTEIGQIHYDYLILASGSCTNFFGLNDIEKNAVGMKTIQEALDIRSLILQNLEMAVAIGNPEKRKSLLTFVVVGGGPAGVETAGALAEFKKYVVPNDYPDLDSNEIKIFLIEAGDRLLRNMHEKLSKKSFKYLQEMGIEIMLNTVVKNYDGNILTTDKQQTINAGAVIWTAGVKGNALAGIEKTLLSKDHRIIVDKYFRIPNLDNVFAIGDLALQTSENFPHGHPMVAPAAIQQGRYLGKNFQDIIQNKKVPIFEYIDKGSMSAIGRKKAVAQIKNMLFSGYFAWLLWSVIHLISISGFKNKLIVGIDWIVSYFSYEKSNRFIIRKFKK